MSISFRASSTQNPKLTKTYVTKEMTRPRPFFQNSFRSFKKFTYQALTEHQEQMTNCDNSNSTIKDLDFLKFPQIINDEKLNELDESEENVSEKVIKFTEVLEAKKKIPVESNRLNYKEILRKYYFSSSSNISPSIEAKLEKMEKDMIDLEIINEDIEKKKKKIKEIKESMEHRNSETNGISVINYDTTNTNGNSFQDKINMQKRNIQFTKIVEKLKNQIIEQKKKENQLRMNQNNNFCIQAL